MLCRALLICIRMFLLAANQEHLPMVCTVCLPMTLVFRSGVTTMVDAGTSGWQNFPLFKEQVIDHSQTRILAFLNIFGTGLSSGQAIKDISTINEDSTVAIMQRYRDLIVGSRIGHFDGSDWTPFNTALDAATKMNEPLFVECHLPQYSLRDQLKKCGQVTSLRILTKRLQSGYLL